MKRHRPLNRRPWRLGLLAILLSAQPGLAKADRLVTTTVIPEVDSKPWDQGVSNADCKDRTRLNLADCSVQMTFRLPVPIRGSVIEEAALHLTMQSSGSAPEATLSIDIETPDGQADFASRTLYDQTGGRRIVMPGTLPSALTKPDNDGPPTVTLSLSRVEFDFFGPAQQTDPAQADGGNAQMPTRHLRPRLVVRYRVEGDAPGQAVGDPNTTSAAPFWPDPAPQKFRLVPLGSGTFRSWAPILGNSHAIVLESDEGSAVLKSLSVPGGDTLWQSDPIKNSGQMLLRSPDGARLIVLGGGGGVIFTPDGSDPKNWPGARTDFLIDGAASGSLDLEAARPPRIGPDGAIYITAGAFVDAVDINQRGLWRAAFKRTGPATLSSDGLYLFLATDEGLVAIDTRTGDEFRAGPPTETATSGTSDQPRSDCPPTTSDKNTVDQEAVKKFFGAVGNDNATLHAPVSIVARRGEDGAPRVRLIYATVRANDLHVTGVFDWRLSNNENGAVAPEIRFLTAITGTHGPMLPDTSIPAEDACTGAKTLSAVTARDPLAIWAFDWSGGWASDLGSGAEETSKQHDAIELGPNDAPRLVRDGTDRLYLAAGQSIVTAVTPAAPSLNPDASAELAVFPIAAAWGSGPLKPRLMIGGDGSLYLADANDQSLWLVVPEFNLTTLGTICSPTLASAFGDGAEGGVSVTAARGVRLGAGTTLGPDSTIHVGDCP